MFIQRLQGHDEWRSDPESPYYDHPLIKSRLIQFQKMRENKDILSLKDLLRSGLTLTN
jgi:hypothetical protein